MKQIQISLLKELFINDAFIHYFLGSLTLLLTLPLFPLPKSLLLILLIFLGAVSIVCLPFAFYRIHRLLYLSKNGVEIVVDYFSLEHGIFGTKLMFEYEYEGMKYDKTKLYQTFWSTDRSQPLMKLLINPNKPYNFVILELKKRSIISIIKNKMASLFE